MSKEYEIKREPIIKNGQEIVKYNIYYTGGEFDGLAEFHSYDGIVNGTEREGYKNKNAPDWIGLEKSLRYSHEAALFGKAFTNASDKGFNLFTVTLINGKAGQSSEAALAFAFSQLGVAWTETEKGQINQILTDHKFSIQL